MISIPNVCEFVCIVYSDEAVKPTLHFLCVKLIEHIVQNSFFSIMKASRLILIIHTELNTTI